MKTRRVFNFRCCRSLRILGMNLRPFSCVAFFAMLLATLLPYASTMRTFYDEYNRLFAVADSVNTFGGKLLVEYRKKQNPDNNVVFSPLSLATTFHLIYQGAGGTTKTQINNLLDFSNHGVEASLTGKSHDLATRGAASMACRVYVDNSIQLLKDYIKHVGSNRVRSADFANNSEFARTEINKWVNKRTHGLILRLFSKGDITSMTRMALVNALYFKGKWKYPFNLCMTDKEVFHGVNGEQHISFMTLENKRFDYKNVSELGGVMFELPYKEKDFGLYVLLPNKVDGWKKAEQAYPKYAGKIFGTGFSRKKVNVLKLPKWKMEFTFKGLKDGLKSLGIRDIFTLQANLSAMTNRRHLTLSNVIHKAKINVNEAGTEAGAGTVAPIAESASRRTKFFEIVVDRPFLYFIVDKSDGTVLFQGTQTSFP